VAFRPTVDRGIRPQHRAMHQLREIRRPTHLEGVARMTTLSIWHLFIGLGALAFLVLLVVAIIVTVRDETLPISDTVVWIIVLVVFPTVGLLIWAIYWSVRSARRRGHLPPAGA